MTVQAPETVLSLDEVSKHYGPRRVLTSFSLAIRKQEKILVQGPNGSGKTTLLKIACGMLRPTSGEVSSASKDIWDDIDRYRAGLGVVFEEPYLFPEVSIFNNLRLFSKLHGLEDFEAVLDAWLDYFNLKRAKHIEVKHLSKGERQKASIIRAVIHDPPILILDEPFSGLDQESQARLSEFLGRTPKTILFSSHESAQEDWVSRKVDFSARPT